MDQTIGIEFEVRGVQHTLTQFDQMERGIKRIQTSFSSIAASIQSITASVRSLSAALVGFKSSTQGLALAAGATAFAHGKGQKVSQGGMTPFMYATWAQQGGKPAGKMRRSGKIDPLYQRSRAGMTYFMREAWGSAAREQEGGDGGGRRDRGRGKGPGFKEPGKGLFGGPGSIAGAGFFMIRWIAYHQLFKAASKIFTDLILGGARATIDMALVELGGVVPDLGQREEVYRAGAAFARKLGTTSSENFIKAAAEIGSAMSVKEVGVGTLIEGAKAASRLALIGQTTEKEAAALIAKQVAAYKESPGYRDLTPAEQQWKAAAQLASVIEKAMIWGGGLTTAAKYTAFAAREMGWDAPRALAFTGALATVGGHAGQTARFFRWMTSAGIEPMTQLIGEQAGVFKPVEGKAPQRKAIKEYNETIRMKLQELVLQRLQTDPDKILLTFSRLVKEQVKRGRKLGDMGLPKQWVQILQAYEGVHTQIMGELLKSVREASKEALVTRTDNITKATGLATTKMLASFNEFWVSLVQDKYAREIADYVDRTFGVWGEARLSGFAVGRGEKTLEEIRQKHFEEWAKVGGKDYAESLMKIVQYTSKTEKGIYGWWNGLQQISAAMDLFSTSFPDAPEFTRTLNAIRLAQGWGAVNLAVQGALKLVTVLEELDVFTPLWNEVDRLHGRVISLKQRMANFLIPPSELMSGKGSWEEQLHRGTADYPAIPPIHLSLSLEMDKEVLARKMVEINVEQLTQGGYTQNQQHAIGGMGQP